MSEPDFERLTEQIAQLRVDDVLVGAASTLASVAYAKLGAKDLEQAKHAIDVLGTLVPLLQDEELQRDLGSALANLQVAYADARP